MSEPGPPSPNRGAAGRVAAIHHQTRRGLLQAAIFTVASVVAAIVPHDTGAWLPLHLFVLGGLLTAISTTTQMLAVTWSSAPAPPGRVGTAQRLCLAAGTVAVCAGRETVSGRLVELGGSLVVVSLLAMIPILLTIRHGSVTDRFAPAIDGYIAAMAFGIVGTSTLAIVLATGRWDRRWLQLRDLHLTVNVFGLVGLVIGATLPYFAATQARRKMSRRATPAAVRSVLDLLAGGTAVAAVGQWSDTRALTAIGLVAYAVGIAGIVMMLPIFGRRQFTWAGPRLIQLCAGMAWWLLTTVALAVGAVEGADDRHVLEALVIGGFGQILVSSLAYLGPVVRGGGHRQLTAGFAITRSWWSWIAGNVAAVGALLGQTTLMAVALLVWVVDVVVRFIWLIATRNVAGERCDLEVSPGGGQP